MFLGRTIKHLAKSLGIELGRRPAPLIGSPQWLAANLQMVVADYAKSKSEPLFFVQVGAFDGIRGDPLYPLIAKYEGICGIMLEPQTEPFAKLKQIYGQMPDRIRLVNAAVSEQDGTRVLYRANPSLSGPWVDQIASFDRNVLLKHKREAPGLEEGIIAEPVPTVTFETLLRDVPRVDILQIDAEGYDAEILRMFDVPRRRPAIINFEHRHLARTVFHRALANLISLGYLISMAESDTLCYLRDDSRSHP